MAEKLSLFSKILISNSLAIIGQSWFNKFDEIFTFRLNKNSHWSNLICIFLPINSELLLKNGKINKGKDILLNLILLNFSRVLIWSKKLTPNVIGQYGNWLELLFLLIIFRF